MNTIDSNELIDLFRALYTQQQNAKEIMNDINDNIKQYSKDNDINMKSLKAAYKLFCKYAEGKQDADESDDYSELSSIVDNYFNL